MFERFTDSARQVLVLAQEEARLLGHSFIGTEHLLLGLIHAESSVASEVLTELGASLPNVRVRVEETIGLGGGPRSGSPPFTPRAKKVLELALREAQHLRGLNISTEHILLGLIREGEGVASQVLASLGIDLDEARQLVMQRMVIGEGEALAEDRRFDHPPGYDSVRRGRVVACSFCGQSPPASGKLISGNDAFICEHCVRQWSFRLDSGPTGVGHGWVSRTPSREVPSGFEPEGAEALRAEIRTAFAASTTTSDDGQALPFVEKGGNLGPSLAAANERGRSVVPEGKVATTSAHEIHFYDAERAVVWFSIATDDRTLLSRHRGEAVLVEGEWKMARFTFCEIMAMAGVVCPPAPD